MTCAQDAMQSAINSKSAAQQMERQQPDTKTCTTTEKPPD